MSLVVCLRVLCDMYLNTMWYSNDGMNIFICRNDIYIHICIRECVVLFYSAYDL